MPIKSLLRNFRFIFIVLMLVVAITALGRGCLRGEVAAHPPAEPDIETFVDWYPHPSLGVILVFDGGVEFAHPQIDYRSGLSGLRVSVGHKTFRVWTDGANSVVYTVLNAPIAYRVPPGKVWLPVVKKTSCGGGCQ